MQIIGLVIIVVGVVSIWWWRNRNPENGDDNVVDAADLFTGKRRQTVGTDNNGISQISAIDDPATAAATFIHLVIGDQNWPNAQGRVRSRLADLTDIQMAEDAVSYAKWASRQAFDHDRAIIILVDMLRERLTLEERQDLAAMLEDAALSGDQDIQARASMEAIRLVN